jgi:FAD/FMN-containing dehydrogenase
MQQVQLNPMGPGQTDFFRLVSAAQGTMGVITWASLKCERLPQIQKLFFLPANRLDDLIDCAYKLVRVRLGDELMLLNSSDLASILGKRADRISALKAEMPPWVIIIDVAGRNVLPKERVEVQEKAMMSIAQQFGLKPMSAIPGAGGDEVLQAILNPSKEPHWKLGYKGGCQDIFFLTTLNRIPEFIKTMYSLAEALRYSTSEIGIYIQPLHQGVGCHCEFSLPFDPGDQREIERIQELLNRASEELIKQGAYFSRPYGIWANITYHRDAQTTAILKKMKGVFDPNGVMNPGKLCF